MFERLRECHAPFRGRAFQIQRHLYEQADILCLRRILQGPAAPGQDAAWDMAPSLFQSDGFPDCCRNQLYRRLAFRAELPQGIQNVTRRVSRNVSIQINNHN